MMVMENYMFFGRTRRNDEKWWDMWKGWNELGRSRSSTSGLPTAAIAKPFCMQWGLHCNSTSLEAAPPAGSGTHQTRTNRIPLGIASGESPTPSSSKVRKSSSATCHSSASTQAVMASFHCHPPQLFFITAEIHRVWLVENGWIISNPVQITIYRG